MRLMGPATATWTRVAAVGGVVAALAACGGGGGGSATNPSSANYDPATKVLNAAGLQVCDQRTHEVAGATTGPGFVAAREFNVAPDCKGSKTTANVMTAYQFASNSQAAAGVKEIEKGTPNGKVTVYGPLVIQATGPDAASYLAAVEKQIKKARPTATTTTG
jgi:hypothetical protein